MLARYTHPTADRKVAALEAGFVGTDWSHANVLGKRLQGASYASPPGDGYFCSLRFTRSSSVVEYVDQVVGSAEKCPHVWRHVGDGEVEKTN